MIVSRMLFAAVVVLFFVVLLTLALVYLRRTRRLGSANDVEVLLKRLVDVDRHKLATVAAEPATDDASTLR